MLTLAVLAAACGGYSLQVAVEEEIVSSEEEEKALAEAALSEGGAESVSVGGTAAEQILRRRQAGAGDPKCATNSNPGQGFTATEMKWGTIVPLTGALRPLGEQTARVMKTATETWLNNITKIPGPYDIDWGCSRRPGIYGRRTSLSIFSLQANTPEEALAGMRRLVDVEKVFLARDCYLQSNLMGPATQYQNAKGVPGVWCFFSEMRYPSLAHWNFAPGVDPLKITAVHVGWLISKQGRQRLSILADPSLAGNQVKIALRVAEHLGAPIPDQCVVYKKAQEAPNGMRSEINQIRNCYGTGNQPDAVIAMDALLGTFGPVEAKSQAWRGADFNVQWTCLTCWVQSLAEICGDACENMITDCQALPCIPWADANRYPAAKVLRDTWQQYLSRDPQDILTYGPAAITGGLGLWLGMTGPEVSRGGLRNTLENLNNWDAGIGPILNTHPGDHFGGKSVWLIEFTGRKPWFDDLTGRFVPLSEVGVPEALTRN
jgi:hypothetical protein